MSDLVAVSLWDVRWRNDGFGKHGNGPFATKRQAEACLRAVGWEGEVERALFTMERKDAAEIYRRAGRSLQEYLKAEG